MLRSIDIENYVLIKSLHLDMQNGFSVITGETGAGKSILLGALHLVLGGRSDSKAIRTGANKCVVEALFDIQDYELQPFFEENDLDYEDECIFRREIWANGKSRQFLNDSPVTAAVLKKLGDLLIDIHSQHENLLLKDGKFQLQLVDAYAHNQLLLQHYVPAYKNYLASVKELEALQEKIKAAQEEADYWQFQYNQLEEAQLKENELEEREAENETLEHADEIQQNLYNAASLLQDENGVLSQLKDASQRIKHIASFSAAYQELYNRIESCYIELKDWATEAENESERVNADPERLEENRNRLDTIYSLLQKHRLQTIPELLAYQKELEEKLSLVNHSEEEVTQLTKRVQDHLKTVQNLAHQLHEARSQAAPEIAGKLSNQLQELGMKNAQMEIRVSATEHLQANGQSKVEIFFSSNKNQEAQAVEKIASGGEISRIMLCIKHLLAQSGNMPTLIFDEIDTGISGETASLMAQMLQEMSTHAQIICITHLPQIAAKGQYHYYVQKIDRDQTETEVIELKNEQRVQAIARMLSGTEITEAALQNAQVLLKN